MITLERLAAVNRQSIKRAGPRYTPAIDPKAPNLRITELADAFDALGQSPEYKKKLQSFEQAMKGAWIKAPPAIKELFDKPFDRIEAGASLLRSLRNERPGRSRKTLHRISNLLEDVYQRLSPYETLVYTPPLTTDEIKPSREDQQRKIYDLQQFTAPYDELRALVRSPEFDLIQNNRLFLLGTWGTGKTHLLCDIAKHRMSASAPTLLLLAQTFPRKTNPLAAICQTSGLAKTPEELLSGLNRLGRQRGCRALLVVDAINEGDRTSWFKHVKAISLLMDRYPYVALVLSCRTPFASQVMPLKVRGDFIELKHSGFADIEFDAQREFFKYYKIPAPHLPLLAPEFSKPLFLKILCETVSSLSRRSKQKRINEFASGHKGMTKLLEDFVFQIGSKIEADFNLTGRACWFLLKGTGDGARKVGISPRMAELGTDYLTKAECLTVIMAATKLSKQRSKQLLARAMADGLLAEDGIYEGKWQEVVRLPYQRFSDHLISRHLLSLHLSGPTAASIRKAFEPNMPLGKAFETDRWGNQYKMPGIASALMLEFPERVKRLVPENQRELYFYLPKKNQGVAPLAETFIDGLLWRDTESFSKQTDKIVGHFLESDSPYTARTMLEALTCLASRTGHPYSAQRLFKYLAKKKLIERDLFWSEYLRHCERHSAVYRVMDWILEASISDVGEETARNLCYLCASFLTSTVRPLRDKATHCLVELGQRYPAALFSVTLENLAHNDFYITERLVAACYGTLMRVWAFAGPDLGTLALPLALALKGRLRGSKSSPPIEHILTRDYATGILSLVGKLVSKRDLARVHPPRNVSARSAIPKANNIVESDVEAADRAIQMDFDNYTTGRLVEGRSNYDDSHVEYKNVQRQIRWRILNLGYTPDAFEKLDGVIANSNYHHGRREDGSRTDRYGKKYSWIAFFEVAGRRQLDGRLPDRDNPRMSDTDIDPSFPAPGLKWKPPTAPLFERQFSTAPNWLAHGPAPDYRHLLVRDEVDGVPGPWILMDGYISQVAPKDKREAFTFLRGLLIAPRNRTKLAKLVHETEYPGNEGIPRASEDHYIFAGEIGWSPKVHYWLRRPDGTAKPHLSPAFNRTEHARVLKRYGSLSSLEKLRLSRVSILDDLMNNGSASKREAIPSDKLVAVDSYKHIPGVKVEIPSMWFSWESYHSGENSGGQPMYVAPAIVEFLRLKKLGAGVDLFDSNQRLATLYRTFGGGESKERFELLYIRADLLKSYLRKVNRKLSWVNWGERAVHYSLGEKLRDDPEMQALWGQHAHIHKQISDWN